MRDSALKPWGASPPSGASPLGSRRRAHARQRFETSLRTSSLRTGTLVGEELMRDSALKPAPLLVLAA